MMRSGCTSVLVAMKDGVGLENQHPFESEIEKLGPSLHVEEKLLSCLQAPSLPWVGALGLSLLGIPGPWKGSLRALRFHMVT